MGTLSCGTDWHVVVLLYIKVWFYKYLVLRKKGTHIYFIYYGDFLAALMFNV